MTRERLRSRLEFVHFEDILATQPALCGVSPCQGETGAILGRRERVRVQRAFSGVRLGIHQCGVDHFQHIVHFGIYLPVPKSNHSVTLLVE